MIIIDTYYDPTINILIKVIRSKKGWKKNICHCKTDHRMKGQERKRSLSEISMEDRLREEIYSFFSREEK